MPRRYKTILATNRALALALGTVLAVVAPGCGGDDGGAPSRGLYTGPIIFYPHGEDDMVYDLYTTVWAGGQDRTVVIDTGSIYYFLATPFNSSDLPCQTPQFFYYGGGIAEFCPGRTDVVVQDPRGRFTALMPEPLVFGQAYFIDWGGLPYGILGIAGSLGLGLDFPEMRSVIEQVAPEALSFTFPNGLTRPGSFQFAPLAEVPASAVRIPLVDPGNLGYGYTARLLEADYVVDGAVQTRLVQTPTGVVLESGGSQTRIATDLIAFFDTGTSVPFLPLDGDVPFVSDQAPYAQFPTDPTAPNYDRVVLHFEDEAGRIVTLAPPAPPAPLTLPVLTARVVPAGLQHLVAIVGLNFIGHYDFQFEFRTTLPVAARAASATMPIRLATAVTFVPPPDGR